MCERKPAYEGVEPEALSLQEIMFFGLVAGGSLELEAVSNDREAYARNLRKLREAWHMTRGTVAQWNKEDQELKAPSNHS